MSIAIRRERYRLPKDVVDRTEERQYTKYRAESRRDANLIRQELDNAAMYLEHIREAPARDTWWYQQTQRWGGESLSELLSVVIAADKGVRAFYEDPMTDAVGMAHEMGPMVWRNARRKVGKAFEEVGITDEEFLAWCRMRLPKTWIERHIEMGVLPGYDERY